MTDRVTLTREEAAACLGIGVRTLQDWTAEGFIPSIKRRGIRLYSVDALRAWAKDASEYDGAGETPSSSCWRSHALQALGPLLAVAEAAQAMIDADYDDWGPIRDALDAVEKLELWEDETEVGAAE